MKQTFLFLLSVIWTYSSAQHDGWNISTTDNSTYTGIVLANGRLGILPSKDPLKTEHIVFNNVYEKESEVGVSRVLKGINFGNLMLEIDGEEVTADNISDWKQTLSLKDARLITSFSFKNKVVVTYSVYALRNIQYTGYIDVQISAQKGVTVKVGGRLETPTTYLKPMNTFRTFRDLENSIPVLQTVAKSKFGKQTVGASAMFIWHDINSVNEEQRPELTHTVISEYSHQLSFEKKLETGETLNFAWTAAECASQEFTDPRSESERFAVYNLLTPKKNLLEGHNKLWEELWKGDIIIEGDLTSQQDVRLALYHLYAFGRADSDLSISPMGLSSQGYNGHVFWDAELWMFPPLLVLNQGIARSMVNYRSDRLAAAKRKAINFGFKGAMFPWESDHSGEEATPTWALTGTFEHHITADVGIAFWNYYRTTKDKQWLKERGYPMLKEVADFWVSRSSENSDGSYSIKNVIGANEFAHNIDDNAFTNGAAITALQYATLAAQELGLNPDQNWNFVAKHIKIHQFDDGTTKEHSAYNGEIIKQADVNLLAYPLDIINDQKRLQKDLKFYEPKLAPDGPAMGKSIFAVIYARMGDVDNAFRLFKESYEPNKRAPFGALAESSTSQNPYFATCAGGMLQTVLFGFGGLHFTENGIIQKNATLPKEWKSLTIKGVGPENKTFVIE